jgi:hypothetical protein
MSKRVCAIVATPPGFNTGMVAVELALQTFVRRHRLAAGFEVKRLCAFEERLASLSPERRALELRRADAGVDSSPLHSLAELDQYDAILYWGDFLHMAQYLRSFGRHFARLNPQLAGECAGSLERVLLLEGATEATLRKAISFGSCLAFNNVADALDPAYGPKLSRFVRGAAQVWVRDVFSAAQVARERGDLAGRGRYWGPDCAQLLDGVGSLDGTSTSPQCLVFFGRSRSLSSALHGFCVRLAAAHGAELAWLPWGSTGGFPQLATGERWAPTVLRLDPEATATEMIHQVARARIVVSDTYHLCVIAWTFGVPAICIAETLDDGPTSVNSGRRFAWRDKRETFYSQYDALDLFVHSRELDDPARAEARLHHLVTLGGQPEAVRRIAASIRAHASAGEAELAALLERL